MANTAEEARAAAYREQQKTRVANQKANAVLLKGDSAARDDLNADWAPVVAYQAQAKEYYFDSE